MRSAFFGPLLVSLALHALAGLLLVRLQLAGHEPSSGPELTIGLSALPELNAPTEREPALPTEAAAMAAPEAKWTAVDQVTADRPAEVALKAPDILATSAPSEKAQAALPAASAAAAEPVRERPADALEAATPTNASSPAASASAAQAAPPVFAPSAVETGAPAAVATAPDTSPPPAPVSPAQPTEVTLSAREAPALPVPASADASPMPETTGPNSIVEILPAPTQTTALPAQAKPIGPEAAPVADATATEASASKRDPPALLADGPVEVAAATEPPAPAAGSAAGAAAETNPTAPLELPPAGQLTAAPAEAATVAALEPGAVASTDAADPDEAAQVERARRFIAGYDGGPCVFVAPVRLASGAAEIDGFAAAKDSFDTFDREFMAKAGFESHVTGQTIRGVQCPAVEFLRRLHAGRGVQPVLRLDSPRVSNRGTLTGSVRDFSERPIQLFLVLQSGVIQDLTSNLSGEGAEHRFAFAAPQRGTEKGDMPELLVAVAGRLTVPPTTDTTAFFEKLARKAELGTELVGAAAKLFLLGD